MRAKTDHSLGLFARGMILNRVHHPLEDLMGDFLRRSMMPQEFMQAVTRKIDVIEFEQGFAGLFAEPQHGLLNQKGRPLDAANHPGRRDARQILQPQRYRRARPRPHALGEDLPEFARSRALRKCRE